MYLNKLIGLGNTKVDMKLLGHTVSTYNTIWAYYNQ